VTVTAVGAASMTIADGAHDSDDLLDGPADRPDTPRPSCAAGVLGDNRASSPVNGDGQQRPAARTPRILPWCGSTPGGRSFCRPRFASRREAGVRSDDPKQVF
jgi:hypothetical protein